MTQFAIPIPVIGFVAPSGTGKTTLLRQVIALLAARGVRVGVAKQARDDFDVDIPGKDSYELRKAGIESVLIAGDGHSALIVEHPHGADPQLAIVLRQFDTSTLDIVLVEGFSEQVYPKIEVLRKNPAAPRYPHDPDIIAVVAECPEHVVTEVPVFDLNDPSALVRFILGRLES